MHKHTLTNITLVNRYLSIVAEIFKNMHLLGIEPWSDGYKTALVTTLLQGFFCSLIRFKTDFDPYILRET